MVTLASRMLTSPHVRLVWAKAPGVICLLPPCHQGDDDEVHQDQVHGVNDDDGEECQSYLDSDRTLPGKAHDFQSISKQCCVLAQP